MVNNGFQVTTQIQSRKENLNMGEFDPHQPFTVGSEIEVSIDEEGFKGALFRATILKLPTTISPSKKKKKALVEYKTLVTENRSTPLKERVDALSLRPIPPDTADRVFELGDIVDAVDKDGWWTGVVCYVLKNGGYSVFFMNPMHVMSFQQNQLRLHQDWVDGNWVFPQKMDTSILKDHLDTFLEGASIPDNVQPESSKNAETNNEKENTYSIISRNDLVEHPSICDEKYASFVLASSKRRRSLIRKSRISNPVKMPGERNSPTEDGLKKTESKTSWGKSFSKNATPNRDCESRIHRNFLQNNNDSSDKFGSPKGGVEVETIKDVDGSDALKEQEARFINGIRRNRFEPSQWTRATDFADKEGKEDNDVIEITPTEVSKINKSERNEQLASEEKQMTPAKIPDEARNGVENSTNNQTKEKGLEPEQQQTSENSSKRKRRPGRPRKLIQDFRQQRACKNSYKRKRGRPRKLMIVPSTAEDMEQDEIGWNPNKEAKKSRVTGYMTNDSITKSASSNIDDDDDDRPLLMWLGGMQGPASNNSSGQTTGSPAMEKTKESEQVDALSEVTTSTTPEPPALNNNQGCWPLVKNSPIWSAIDSLEVFKLIPQMPHFRPLSAHKEECREGLAIASMVTFANLVEKISKLQLDNTRQVFVSILASLYELEQHGFNISMLCNRVNELLFIKDSQMRYLEETKQVENKILQHTENKTKLAEESKDIEQEIAELQKRRSSIKLEMETKEFEITALQSHLKIIRGCAEDTKQHFEKQTSLPF